MFHVHSRRVRQPILPRRISSTCSTAISISKACRRSTCLQARAVSRWSCSLVVAVRCEENGTVIRGDVFRYLKSCRQQFDFIFADPPYALDKLPEIPSLILGNALLKPGGVFVFEHGKQNDFSADEHFVEHRAYGSVNFSIFKKSINH